MNELIELRDFLHSARGELLLRYLTDFMVEISLKNTTNAEWIKGMGMLINHLKEIDEKCRKANEQNRR